MQILTLEKRCTTKITGRDKNLLNLKGAWDGEVAATKEKTRHSPFLSAFLSFFFSHFLKAFSLSYLVLLSHSLFLAN